MVLSMGKALGVPEKGISEWKMTMPLLEWLIYHCAGLLRDTM
jgi:hypothetical protein